jgi:LysM repeat protein
MFMATPEKYVIKRGDTLSQLAKKFGIPLQQLQQRNKIVNPDLIKTGEELDLVDRPRPISTFPEITKPIQAASTKVRRPERPQLAIDSQFPLDVNTVLAKKARYPAGNTYIYSKENGKLYIIGKEGQLLSESNAGIGEDIGDDKNTARFVLNDQHRIKGKRGRATTPSGKYYFNYENTDKALTEIYGGRIFNLSNVDPTMNDPNYSIAAHPIYKPDFARRSAVIDRNNPDKRVSMGCINCRKELLAQYPLSPKDTVYVTPEPLRNLQFRQEGGSAQPEPVVVEKGEYAKNNQGQIVQVHPQAPSHDDSELALPDGRSMRVPGGRGGVMALDLDSVLSASQEQINRGDRANNPKDAVIRLKPKEATELAKQAGLKLAVNRTVSPSRFFEKLIESRDKRVLKLTKAAGKVSGIGSRFEQESAKANAAQVAGMPSDDQLYDLAFAVQEQAKDESPIDFNTDDQAQSGKAVGPRLAPKSAAYVDSVLDANRNMNFVQRYLHSDGYPSLKLPSGVEETHGMRSYKGNVFPTIIQHPNGSLEQLEPDDAWEYAQDSHQLIDLKDPELATWFSRNGYKLGTQQPKKQQGGWSTTGYLNDSPDRFNDFNLIPGNDITMEDVDQPLMLYGDGGEVVYAQPGRNYHLPSSKYVLELPMAQQGRGLSYRMYLNKTPMVRQTVRIGMSSPKTNR